MSKISKLYEIQLFAEGLAKEAADLAKSYFLDRGQLEILSKNPRDFVSQADRLVENMIRERIAARFPDHNVVGEEAGGTPDWGYWSVDPIDGTSNFLAGLPIWGVSIGYCVDGLPAAGAMCLPLLDILLSANESTAGVRYNTQPLIATEPSVIPSIVVGQSPYWDTASFREAEDIFRDQALEPLNFRCSIAGTAFASLGWTHGYYEEKTNMWDVAAGYIIAKQAGLSAKIYNNADDDKLTICVLSRGVDSKVGSALENRQAGHALG